MIINSYANDDDEENGYATMDKELKKWCNDNGIKPYYTNAIKCRTPKDYKIKASEIKDVAKLIWKMK
jgi:hypothetical protein